MDEFELEELKKVLKNAIRHGGNYADILKPNGNFWLYLVVEDMIKNDEPIENIFDKCEDIFELFIAWGFLSYRRGLHECYEKNNNIPYIL